MLIFDLLKNTFLVKSIVVTYKLHKNINNVAFLYWRISASQITDKNSFHSCCSSTFEDYRAKTERSQRSNKRTLPDFTKIC